MYGQDFLNSLILGNRKLSRSCRGVVDLLCSVGTSMGNDREPKSADIIVCTVVGPGSSRRPTSYFTHCWCFQGLFQAVAGLALGFIELCTTHFPRDTIALASKTPIWDQLPDRRKHEILAELADG